MKKTEILKQLADITAGKVGETSALLAEFLRCPHYQSCCRILARAVEGNRRTRTSGRLLPPPGTIFPG